MPFMRAVVIREHGGVEALSVEDLPTPEPGPGSVRIEVRACAVNHLDLWVRRGVPGHHFPLPLIPGNDIAGVVDALGPGCEGLEVGDEVVVAPGTSCGNCGACADGRDHHCRSYAILGEHRDGGYADHVVVPRVNVIPKPTNLNFAQAATTLLAPLTAWNMLTRRARLEQGEWVLVQAAGSGVSSAAIQIAKLWNARVIAVARSEEKCNRASELGADFVLSSETDDVAKEVRKITNKLGVQVVVDHVGEATWETSMRCLGWQGRFVTCGSTTGSVVNVNLRHLFFKSLSLLGATMGPRGDVHRVVNLYAQGLLQPLVDRVLPLEDAAQAHQLLEDRKVFGKIVLTTKKNQ